MIEFNEANNARWVIPVSPTEVEVGKLLPDEYKTDGVFRYNPNLGDGRPDRWKRENPIMYIKSPCTSRHEVKSIVDDLQINSRRRQRQLAVDAAPPPAPPSDWHYRMEVLKRDNKAKDKRIKELEKEVKKLRLIKNRTVNTKQTQKRRATDVAAKTSEDLALYESNSILWDNIVKLLSSAGGLSRLTIFWDEWHDEHDEAAHVLFGYRNWKETKQYLRDYFPDELGPDSAWPSPIVANLIDSDLKNVPLTQVEKCLLCRMFFHLRDRQKFLALIIDRHRTTVGNVIKEWAPLWGEVGEDLSILDVTEDYLIKEEPDKIAELFLEKIVFNDGKDWRIGSKHNDNVATKLMYSAKNDCDSARGESWTSAAGLGFEHTRVYGANLSENALQRLHGSMGREKADVESWEDVAKKPKHNPTPTELCWTALDDMLTASDIKRVHGVDCIEEMLDNICAFDGVGADHDDVVGTATATGLERLGLNDEEVEEDSNAEESSDANSPVFGGMNAIREWAHKYKMLNETEAANNSEEGNTKKMAPLLSPERLEELSRKALLTGPNSSGWRKLRQLERHERLHRSYEDGKIHKCLLSFFLLVTTNDRHKLLAWMGSSMVPDIEKPTREELPEIYLRLAKIPPSFCVGTDKGFKGTDRDYPWFNRVFSPTKLSELKGYRKTGYHIRRDRPLCSARFSSETFFFRVDDDDIMKDTIPYWHIPIFPYAHALAHGEANLCMPFRTPGRNSIVGKDYWDNKKDYTRLDQDNNDHANAEMTRTEGAVHNVEMEEVQQQQQSSCTYCGSAGWGMVYLCQRCNHWYHNECHNVNECHTVPNPYLK